MSYPRRRVTEFKVLKSGQSFKETEERRFYVTKVRPEGFLWLVAYHKKADGSWKLVAIWSLTEVELIGLQPEDELVG